MTTLQQLESKIDKKLTVQLLRKELDQLYYYVGAKNDQINMRVEEETIDYLSYTSSILYAGKRKNYCNSDEKLINAIVEKDKNNQLQQQIETQRSFVVQELLKGIASLPEKERLLLEDVYLKRRNKEMICYQEGFSSSTLRRKIADAIYHLAILLHRTILIQEET